MKPIRSLCSSSIRYLIPLAAIAALAPVCFAQHRWWLPANYSQHGGGIDSLFAFITWLTVIVNIGVFVVMGYFLVKYRHDPNKKKAHFTHGNPRLEMTWTIAPAIILAFISLASKKVWDQYRFGDSGGNPTLLSVADLEKNKDSAKFLAAIDQSSKGAQLDPKTGLYAYVSPGGNIVSEDQPLTPEVVAKLKAANITQVKAYPADKKPARLLVIGQQFKWNVIYAGPDGKLGKYLVFPRPTDKKWPDPRPEDEKTEPYLFQNVPGPASLPYEQAVTMINQYIDSENPLGKDFEDPAGKDDNWDKAPGRPIILPKGRPIEVQLSSKDVIHSFFLPNFRVKLDAVPGLRGVIRFVSTVTSKEQSKDYTLDQLATAMKDPSNKVLLISVDEKSEPKAKDAKSPGAFFDRPSQKWKYNDKEGKTIIRAGVPMGEDKIAQLKEAGVAKVTVYRPFDLVCEELCGQGHFDMSGQVLMVSNEEWIEQFETKAETAAIKSTDGIAAK